MQKTSIENCLFFNKDYINTLTLEKKTENKIDSEALNEFILAIEQSKKISSIESKKTPNDFGFQKLSFLQNNPGQLKSEKKKGSEEEDESNIEKKASSKENEIFSGIDSIIAQIKNAGTNDNNLWFDYSRTPMGIAPKSGEYERHSKIYKDFINSIVYSDNYSKEKEGSYGYTEKSQEIEFRQGDEIMNHNQRKEYVKNLMKKTKFKTGPSHINEDDKKRYEYWKIADSFNLFLSFLMYENPSLYQ